MSSSLGGWGSKDQNLRVNFPLLASCNLLKPPLRERRKKSLYDLKCFLREWWYGAFFANSSRGWKYCRASRLPKPAKTRTWLFDCSVSGEGSLKKWHLCFPRGRSRRGWAILQENWGYEEIRRKHPIIVRFSSLIFSHFWISSPLS